MWCCLAFGFNINFCLNKSNDDLRPWLDMYRVFNKTVIISKYVVVIITSFGGFPHLPVWPVGYTSHQLLVVTLGPPFGPPLLRLFDIFQDTFLFARFNFGPIFVCMYIIVVLWSKHKVSNLNGHKDYNLDSEYWQWPKSEDQHQVHHVSLFAGKLWN